MCRLEIGRRSAGAENSIHVACKDKNCSDETIRKLIDEHGGELLEERDVYGRVPLFYAIRRQVSLSVVQTLLDADPDSILKADYCGELPLYMLFGPRVHPSILEHILRTRPSLALFVEKRFSGSHTLLQRMCAQWMSTVRKAMNSQQDNNAPILPREMVRSDTALVNQWTKLVLLVQAAHNVASGPSNIDNIPELHAALQLPVQILPEGIRCQFVEMYPEQAGIPMDSCHGETSSSSDVCCAVLPLHYFLSDCHHRVKTSKELKTKRAVIRMKRRRLKRSPVVIVPFHSSLLKSLVRAFPQAASMKVQTTDNHCHFPLQVAISTGTFDWDHGLRELVFANPSALSCKDGTTQLVPFLQETTQELDYNKKNLGTVYNLLREDPSVLATMVSMH